MWRGAVDANELGLWRASDGKLTALVNVGPANPREFAEVTSTTAVLAPVAAATGGDVKRLDDGSVCACRGSSPCGRATPTRARTGSASRYATPLSCAGIGVLPVFAGLLGLLLLVGSLAATWTREGR